MTPETPAKVTATTLPDEPEVIAEQLGEIENGYCVCNVPYGYTCGLHKRIALVRDALLQSFNAERLRAEAMAKDAGRLQTLMDASGQFYERGYEHHMIGRLREYIDSEKEAIDTAIEQGAQHG